MNIHEKLAKLAKRKGKAVSAQTLTAWRSIPVPSDIPLDKLEPVLAGIRIALLRLDSKVSVARVGRTISVSKTDHVRHKAVPLDGDGPFYRIHVSPTTEDEYIRTVRLLTEAGLAVDAATSEPPPEPSGMAAPESSETQGQDLEQPADPAASLPP